MNYIPADKLIAEIERLKERYGSITLKSITAQNYQEGRLIGYEDALYEIKKLFQQVQSDNEDIDKIAQEFYEHLYELKRRNNVPTNLYDKQEIIDIWKDGIEYGRNHPKQEQPECIYGRTPEEREKRCKFCSAICEARIEQEQLEVDATTLRREAIGKAMEVYPPSINEDADGMPYDEHTDLQQGFITGYELGFNARKEE